MLASASPRGKVAVLSAAAITLTVGDVARAQEAPDGYRETLSQIQRELAELRRENAQIRAENRELRAKVDAITADKATAAVAPPAPTPQQQLAPVLAKAKPPASPK